MKITFWFVGLEDDKKRKVRTDRDSVQIRVKCGNSVSGQE